ncbi:phosphocarrier protein FPr [Nocardia transvalensis]|uniref:Phosphocarrier protein HPr n=1 Tax=Nocardia transvalensis TaxID=37333 RepID=A0A7W9UGS5_9NOCA|nr:phosphocarrier protein FPr [Nocardia transvalensis]
MDLAREMVPDRALRVEVAAGLDEETFGTDAVAVASAIADADSGDGVLVLMDLGSAVLSAELALELLDSPHEVRLCSGPVVEGLVAAAVSAAGGAALAEVADEAVNALSGKQSQLGDVIGSGSDAASAEAPESEAVRATFRVDNEHGLHARPAARLVAELRGRDTDVRLRNLSTEAGPVSARSLSRLAALGVLAGHQVEVTATGPDAREAVDAILALAGQRFGEPAPESGGAGRPREPRPASGGIAIGPVWQARAVEFAPGASGSPEDERRTLDSAIRAVHNDIRAAVARERGNGRLSAAEIFEAHLVMLEDEELVGEARRRMDRGTGAAAAWAEVLGEAAAEMERLPDDYQRARAADLRAVRDQVVAAISGSDAGIDSRPGILVAADLTPAQVSGLDGSVVGGIVLAEGSPTSHASIIARAKGIPVLVGAGADVLRIPEGTTVALDGDSGQVVIDPDPSVVAEFSARATEMSERRRGAEQAAQQPAVTRDGVAIEVGANIGSVAEAVDARRRGADFAGLVRTEFLFLHREKPPSVDEQEQVYRETAQAFDGRRVVLRTLDVGGDKPLPYLPQPPEANPFLGLRGIRLTLAHPDLFRDQLRALARVAADHPVRVMFPMVTDIDEVRAARQLLEEVAPQDLRIDVGIMVETPATAAKAAAFTDDADFFSIGTNDLTQYALAAERGNNVVASLADALDPGVLHLIDQVCRGAGTTPVAVCGELAADPAAIPILLGLGVRELSVTPPAIPEIKARTRTLDLATCRSLATEALRCPSAAAVRALVR